MLALPKNAVLLSFEGPDPYSMVGGLGTRVTELSAALAQAGTNTTLVFVGDPARPPVERPSANLEYRRWCQWISAYHPGGVYDGELGKRDDFTVSVPPMVAETIVEPAAHRGEDVLVIAEDWQTAPCTIALHATLRARGLSERSILMWNANNTYGFDSIDWPALSGAARITTVSRYMKLELQQRGVESLVIPNGIPARLLDGPKKKLVRLADERLRRPFLFKIARYEEDKRWMQAVEAFALLHARHPEATLVVRGGREPYGEAIFARARELGLRVDAVTVDSREPRDVIVAIAAASGPIVNVLSYIPEAALVALYRCADAVLANSGREPFGLVGLEVMAAGGVAVTGSTGEDYAAPFENAIVCDTADPRELDAYLEQLVADCELSEAIREAGEETAERYVWECVLETLCRKIPARGSELDHAIMVS
jgi:glycosyltransferase involved in cell wall biosynthesis